MRALDLFSGIGLFSLGLHKAGFQTVAACEIKEWKRLIFADLVGDMPMYGDIKELTGERVIDDVGPVELVFGSPPCTAFSSANTKGRGILDDRLFFEAIRIIRETGPRWIVLENSPTARTRGIDGILAALEEAGYATWPLVVGADNAGAPHLRKRVWIVGLRADAHGHGRQHAGGRQQRGQLSAEETVSAHGQINGRRARGPGRPDPGHTGQPQQALQAAANAREPEPERSATMGGRGRRPQEAGGSGLSPTDTDESRLAFWQSLAGDHGPQLAALERDIGPAIHDWSGGLGRYLRLAYGCPAKTARMLMSACGDGVVVGVAEVIGRAIRQAELNAHRR